MNEEREKEMEIEMENGTQAGQSEAANMFTNEGKRFEYRRKRRGRYTHLPTCDQTLIGNATSQTTCQSWAWMVNGMRALLSQRCWESSNGGVCCNISEALYVLA